MQLEQLGPYRIGRKLGRGGMGTVYAAVETASGEPAAVKVLSAALAQDEGFRERFKAEIESLRKLHHPNIVRLLGFGEQDGFLFYAMELVAGRSLEEELLAGRRFDWRHVTDFGIQVCRALRHAHDRGVIHRDIKPANLLLADDVVKLSDFGIAKLFGNMGLTADGGVLGTAEYMAPEQADGRTVTPRSDLYSLGGVLYALLAGRPPFRATNLMEMLQLQRFAEPEPVRRWAPDVPPELEAIVQVLLEKEPERRVPTALVLSRRLESMRHGLAARPDERPATPKPELAFEFGKGPEQTLSALPSQVSPRRSGERAKALPEFLQPTKAAPLVADPPAAEQECEEPADSSIALQQSISRSTSRFTAVLEEQPESLELEREETPWVSPQTWLLVACMVVMGLGVWFFVLRPPSADGLYGRISTAASLDSTGQQLARVEHDIEIFLAMYPSDHRRQAVEAFRDRVELYHMERRLELRRRGWHSGQISAVEAAYIDALQEERTDPDTVIRKLRAILALFGAEADDMTAATHQCLLLCQRKLAALEERVDGRKYKHLPAIDKQLNRADALVVTDPAKARRVWRGVIELYADKGWAAPAVERAKAGLSRYSAER